MRAIGDGMGGCPHVQTSPSGLLQRKRPPLGQRPAAALRQTSVAGGYRVDDVICSCVTARCEHGYHERFDRRTLSIVALTLRNVGTSPRTMASSRIGIRVQIARAIDPPHRAEPSERVLLGFFNGYLAPLHSFMQ